MNTRHTPHLRPRPSAAAAVAAPLDVRLMHLSASLMLVGLVAGVLAAGVWSLVQLPMFALSGITVRGDLAHNDAASLQVNVAKQFSGNFFTVDLGQVRQAFERAPWVRQASVQREFPNRLRVTLQEHQVAAHWGEVDELRLINSYGEVFEAELSDTQDTQLPRLSGPASQSRQVLRMYLALLPVLDDLALRLERLTLTDRGSWRARLHQGGVMELGRGSVEEVMVRLQGLRQTLADATHKLGRSTAAVEAIDLRHDNGYALRLRGVSTQDVSSKR